MSLARLNDDLPAQGVTAFGTKTESNAKSPTLDPLDTLSKFIPTEILAPYLAFLAYAVEHKSPSPEFVYWIFVAATPVFTIFFQFVKSAREDSPWPAPIAVVWRAIAATIAFALWGITPPGSAFQAQIGGPAWAGLAAICVSPLLAGADEIMLKIMQIKRVSR